MRKENTYKILLRRSFLIEGLPDPLSPRDGHLQIFDNYLENTRIRLRKIRVPETKSWTRVLEQIYPLVEHGLSKLKISQMFLNEQEYKTFEIFKGREIRKNRYFFELEDLTLEIDIFLGALWGLNIATAYFENDAEIKRFTVPDFVVAEITEDAFFFNGNLVDKTFKDVQNELSK